MPPSPERRGVQSNNATAVKIAVAHSREATKQCNQYNTMDVCAGDPDMED